MKFISLIVALLLTGATGGNPEKIVWQKDRPLGWNDFRGRAVKAGDYVASTNSGISFSYSVRSSNGVLDFNYIVNAYFYPERSWYRPDLVDDYILGHEQTHFDISELFARKLRKELGQIKPSAKIKKEVEALYADIQQMRTKMQLRFDQETDHSKIREEEYRWREFVKSKLREYDAWR